MAKQKFGTRLLSLLLSLLTVLTLLPVSTFAASLGDGTKTVNLTLGARKHYLSTTAGTRLGASSYEYRSNDGLVGPAYCIDHGLDFTAKTLPVTGKYNASPATAGTFANGYPQHSVDTFLGLYLAKNPILSGLTKEEFAYATQLAVWATLGQLGIEGTAFTRGREIIAQPLDDTQQMRVFRAIQLILIAAHSWDRVYQTGMYIRLDDSGIGANISIPADATLEYAADNEIYGIKREVIGGKSYYTREYTFASATSTYYSDYSMHLWADGAPSGTIFTDTSNRELARGTFREQATWVLPTDYQTTKLNDNGFEYVGKAKLCIPVDTVPNAGEITIRCGAHVMQYEIYLAYNERKAEQSYIIADPSKGALTSNAVLNWGGILTLTGALELTKTNGVGDPLSGAGFVLTGTDGSRRTGTTNTNGVVRWEQLDPDVTYTLTETKAPAGYGLAEPVTVRVKAARTNYLTVKDSVEKQLVVRKQDKQSGYSLAGATIAFEQIDGSFRTTKVTDHAGMIALTADELPIGSYKVYEKAAPEGYETDAAPQTVHWDGLHNITLTFDNVRKPTLILYKCDEGNLRSLPGATLEVIKDGQAFTTVTTDDNGLAYVHGITTGYYTVREKVAPEGYVLSTEAYSVYVDTYDPATTDDPRIVIPNRAKPSLLIRKLDEQTMRGIQDCIFEVYRDTVLVGEYKTDSDGEVLLTDLAPGTYLVKEKAAAPSHVTNSTPQQIEIKAGDGLVQMVFLNLVKPGIHLIKLDSQSYQRLANAVYRVELVGGSFSREYTTDENGEIDLSGLAPGTYRVTELSAPEGYLIDTSERIIQLNAGENGVFVFTDTKKPSLRIKKYDPDHDKNVPGAMLRIARIEDGSRYLDRVTDEIGEVYLTDLTPGVYSVQEVEAPGGYVLNATEYHVQLFAGHESSLVIENHTKPKLLIHKTDADEENVPVAGAVFRVKKVDSSTVTEVQTGADGTALVEDLDPGVYEVTEISVPEPYLLDAPSQQITLVPNRTGDLFFQNHKKPSLTILKQNSITGELLANAKFHIYYGSDNTTTGEINDLGVFTTDSTGRIVLTNVNRGWYKLVEESSPQGFGIQGGVGVTEFYLEANTSKTVTVDNVPLSALVVYKYDAKTGKGLEGCRFELRYLSGNTSGTGGTVIGTFITGPNGAFTVTGLKKGTYICQEVESDGNHIIDREPQTVWISGEDQDVVTIRFGNAPLGSLLITKLSDDSKHEPLSGVEFLLTDSSGNYLGNDNGRFTTNAAGEILVDGLEPGMTVIAREVRAKTGYLLDDSPQHALIKSGETAHLQFLNQPAGNLIIRKVSSGPNKEPLEGVEFKITYADGSFVPNANGELSSNSIYYTDKSGEIRISGIVGTVVATETKTIPGYTMDEATRTQTVVVNPNDTQTLTFYNKPTTTLILQKYISGTKNEPLAGVQFLVTDSSGAVVGPNNGYYTTDSAGQIVIEGLTDGMTVTVREVETVDGFVLDGTPQSIKIDQSQSPQRMTFWNERQGGLELIKVNAADKTQRIPNTTFEIRCVSDGGLVDTVTTGTNGRVYVPLKSDSYYAVETEAGKGFLLDSTPVYFAVEDGKTTTKTVTNKAISSILIHKVDSTTGEGIYGVSFILYDSGNNPIAQETSDDRGYVRFEGLTAGRYSLRELENEGYIPDTQRKTVYVRSGETTEIDWKNTPITGQIQIVKTSADYNSVNGWPAGTPIPNTVFEVYNARTNRLADTIRTDKSGRAVSKPLPLGRYKIVEAKAAEFYGLDKTPIEVEIEYAGQIVKVAMTNKSLYTNVSIKKTGYVEVMPGQLVRYNFTGIANNSTTALESFYWRDTLPTNAVRLQTIYTGTWNTPGSYKIVYRTNLSGDTWRTLADNLSTSKNYVLDASPAVLGLASNEYVTEFMAAFGIVPANFRQVEAPRVDCKALTKLTGGTQFVNQADAGGVYNGQWIMATSRWVTRVYAPSKPLPRTGY